MKGSYLNYTGIVVDVHPPKPFTVLDVFIPQLLQTVRVLVIKGDLKGTGLVKTVERRRHAKYPSGVLLQVELQRWSAARGANPCKPFDYTFLRDLRSGLGLNEAYPLRGRQRYYEPVCKVPALLPDKLKAFLAPLPSLPRAQTPPLSLMEVATDASAWDPTAPMPTVWPLRPKLDGKRFLATYRYLEDRAHQYSLRKGVKVEVVMSAQKVLLWTGREYEMVSPGDITPWLDTIDPSRTRKAMLVTDGVHIGKYMRPITNKYTSDGKALFTAKTFTNWGQSEEAVLDEWIEVAPEHIARIPDDPNVKRWEIVMKSARNAAAKPRPPKKKKKD
ncbi:hypothetical protein VKT23_010726 [Stygiomarasmius scandens]|uniref:Uncharacterized protein n=1 Tax=Marasmiellus scandens TaxID=2682957 RepID=A0ABR1JBS3_9AGAR